VVVGTVQKASVSVRSPTVIEVKWNPVNPSSIQGAELIGFKISYRAEGEPSPRTIILVPENNEHTITHLGRLATCVSTFHLLIARS